MIWETATVSVKDTGIGIRNATLVIDGGIYGERQYRWSSGNIPNRFTWDRRFGEVLAPPGEYHVVLTAWDRLGNRGSDAGTILIPEPPTVTPTLAPTCTPTPTRLPSRREQKPTPMRVAIVPAEPDVTAPQKVELPQRAAPTIWWPLLLIVGLAGVLGVAGIFDPRPPAWKRLSKIRNQALLADKSRKKKEEDDS